jgi:hypothetical protein
VAEPRAWHRAASDQRRSDVDAHPDLGDGSVLAFNQDWKSHIRPTIERHDAGRVTLWPPQRSRRFVSGIFSMDKHDTHERRRLPDGRPLQFRRSAMRTAKTGRKASAGADTALLDVPAARPRSQFREIGGQGLRTRIDATQTVGNQNISLRRKIAPEVGPSCAPITRAISALATWL